MTTAGEIISSTKGLPLPHLRPTRLEDYWQIHRLESTHGLLSLPEQDWRSMWLDNPLRTRLGDDWPFGWVLEDSGGKVVGSLANIPTRYTLGGRELIAVTGRGWVVIPEYRGVALWLMDEYFNQAAADLFINTTVNALAVDTFTTFGSARVPLGDWEGASYWITNYRGFARTVLGLKKVPASGLFSYPAAAVLRLKDWFARSLPRSAQSAATIDVTTTFDVRFDAFWEELVRANPAKLLCHRDSRTLAWHFAGPMRAGQLWVFTVSSNNLLRAYCVLKRQDHPSSGLIRMRLVDYQSLNPTEDLLPGLLGAALERCRAEKIHTLEHVGFGLPKMRSFDGHAPYRRKLPAWPFYYQAVDPDLNKKLGSPDVWDASTYDGDASL